MLRCQTITLSTEKGFAMKHFRVTDDEGNVWGNICATSSAEAVQYVRDDFNANAHIYMGRPPRKLFAEEIV